MKRFLTLTVVTSLSVFALAFGTFTKVFETTYKVEKGSELDKASCAVCHVSKKGGKLNAYGLDMEKALGGSKKLTPDVLKKIEGLDSDKDGVKNIDEIKKGALPGVK